MCSGSTSSNRFISCVYGKSTSVQNQHCLDRFREPNSMMRSGPATSTMSSIKGIVSVGRCILCGLEGGESGYLGTTLGNASTGETFDGQHETAIRSSASGGQRGRRHGTSWLCQI